MYYIIIMKSNIYIHGNVRIYNAVVTRRTCMYLLASVCTLRWECVCTYLVVFQCLNKLLTGIDEHEVGPLVHLMTKFHLSPSHIQLLHTRECNHIKALLKPHIFKKLTKLSSIGQDRVLYSLLISFP